MRNRIRLTRLLRFFLLLLAAYLLLEAASLGIYGWRFGRMFSFARLRDQRRLVSQEAAGPGQDSSLDGRRIHPYLGYTLTPGRWSPARGPCSPNEYGFFGPPPPLGPHPWVALVVLTGGTAATDLFCEAGARLTALLQRAPALAGRRVRLVSLALPGYKQPQQLMALSYFLLLGLLVDLVITLDGVNELAVPSQTPAEVIHPTYPQPEPAPGGPELRLQGPRGSALPGRVLPLPARQVQPAGPGHRGPDENG